MCGFKSRSHHLCNVLKMKGGGFDSIYVICWIIWAHHLPSLGWGKSTQSLLRLLTLSILSVSVIIGLPLLSEICYSLAAWVLVYFTAVSSLTVELGQLMWLSLKITTSWSLPCVMTFFTWPQFFSLLRPMDTKLLFGCEPWKSLLCCCLLVIVLYWKSTLSAITQMNLSCLFSLSS